MLSPQSSPIGFTPREIEAMANNFYIESPGTPPSQPPICFTEAPASPTESVYVSESPDVEWGSPLATSTPVDIVVPETPVAPIKTGSRRVFNLEGVRRRLFDL